MNKPALSLVLLAGAIGCGQDQPYYYGGPDITAYAVSTDAVSPEGIRVDSSGNAIDLGRLDELTREFDACAGVTVDRGGVVVKIAPDWYVSPCSGGQGFPCALSDRYKRQLEEQTGKKETTECPWNCAGAVQSPNVVVLAPALAAYKHELIHLVMGIDDHQDQLYGKCE